MLIKSLHTGYSILSPTFKLYTEWAIAELLKKGIEISSSGSEGGFLSRFVATRTEPMPLDIVAVGTFPKSKNGPCFVNSIEKAYRLNENHRKFDHVTSRQSADVDLEQYAGAIICDIGVTKDKQIFSVISSCVRDVLDTKNIWGNNPPVYVKDPMHFYSFRKEMITATSKELEIMEDVAKTIFHNEVKLAA